MPEPNGNLVVTLTRDQSIRIGKANVTVINIARSRIQLLIQAPKDVVILRDDAKSAEQRHRRGTA